MNDNHLRASNCPWDIKTQPVQVRFHYDVVRKHVAAAHCQLFRKFYCSILPFRYGTRTRRYLQPVFSKNGFISPHFNWQKEKSYYKCREIIYWYNRKCSNSLFCFLNNNIYRHTVDGWRTKYHIQMCTFWHPPFTLLLFSLFHLPAFLVLHSLLSACSQLRHTELHVCVFILPLHSTIFLCLFLPFSLSPAFLLLSLNELMRNLVFRHSMRFCL